MNQKSIVICWCPNCNGPIHAYKNADGVIQKGVHPSHGEEVRCSWCGFIFEYVRYS